MRQLRAFTLVELLAVVTIILILAGITLTVLVSANKKAIIKKAKAQLELFNSQLERYAVENNVLVPQENDDTGLILYRALYGDGLGPDKIAGTEDDTEPDGETDSGATVYVADLDPRATSQQMLLMQDGIPVKVVDPWGNPWQYRAGGDANQANPLESFDLWSMGPDGKTNDDPSHEDARDDIKNW